MSVSKTLATASLAALATSKAMVGTNAGGWLVLEPWITPSLFYQFLGNTEADGIGIDSYTMCETLGAEAGNALMRDHWENWITESEIKDMADREVEIVRLPIGDWTLKPYDVYDGCMDGSMDKVQWFLDTCEKYGIKVLLDVHCLKGSQNGFDNSGQAQPFTWVDQDDFSHWEHLSANWIGDWNQSTWSYDNINQDHIDWALDNVQKLMDKWGTHPAMYALEPVNEPWWNTPRDALMDFYRSAKKIVHDSNPDTVFVFHNAFDFSPSWNSLFDDDDITNVVMDTHIYQAWYERKDDIQEYCDLYGSQSLTAQNIKYDVWVGEWALATDTCAMWLGGFNDSNSDLVFDCARVECPYSYLSSDYAKDFDRTADELGPFGSNHKSTIQKGMCPTDSSYFSEEDVKYLGSCAIDAWDANLQGHFLWTIRNELEDKWSYKNAYDKGWLQGSKQQKSFLQ